MVHKKDLILICAGGTGGHINSALGLGSTFKNKGYDVLYYTGTRHLDYKLFEGEPNTKYLQTSQLRYKNPFKIIFALLKNIAVFIRVLNELLRLRPKAAIGAGGYVCGPTLLAAKIIGTPIFILEQNSVMGLTNRLLSSFATNIFTHFKDTKGLGDKFKKKVIISGNPVRKEILNGKFEQNKCDQLRLLVFGGSLGAKTINETIAALLENYPLKISIAIKHQTGNNWEQALKSNNSLIEYESLPYIDDMPKLYQWADIILCRAGASTISELRYVQRPVILVPYPYATDNHQETNASYLKEEVNFPVYILTDAQLKKEGPAPIIKILENLPSKETIHSSNAIVPADANELISDFVVKHV